MDDPTSEEPKIDEETAKILDDDAIEAEEIISDEIPDEFLAFVSRHLEHSNQWVIQVDIYGRGAWTTLKQRIRPSKAKDGKVTSSADDIAARLVEHVRKHSESDRPAKHYRVRASVVDPRSNQPGSRFHSLSVGADQDGGLLVQDTTDPQGPGSEYWRVLADTFDAFGRQAIKAHQAVADQAANFAKYSEQMVKMSEANIGMAERVVQHAVEVEKVKMQDRDSQREHEEDLQRSARLYDLAEKFGPVIAANMAENARKREQNENQSNTKSEKKETPPMDSAPKTSPLAREFSSFITGLTTEERGKFWACFKDDEPALIRRATEATSDDGVRAIVEKLRECLENRRAIESMQAELMTAIGVKCLELQKLLEKAVA